MLYYRRDVMKEAGLSDQPEDVDAAAATWDSYLKMCTTILKTRPGAAAYFGDR